MVSARRGALPRWEWCVQSWSASLTESAAKSITPASSSGSKTHWGKGKGACASATSMQTPAPPHTSAPHFHRFKGQHCSIHQRCGGPLPTPSTSLPAQCHPTNGCTWQTRGWTPLSIAGRFTGALCVPVFPNTWQMCWYNAIRWWRQGEEGGSSLGTWPQPYYMVRDVPTLGWTGLMGKRGYWSFPWPRPGYNPSRFAFFSWWIGRQQ